MELTPAQIANLPTKAATGSKQDVSSNELAGDFETFLTLLTTQMRNQDPLKPMDSTEFVAQLANFSGVEQQVRSNDRLEQIYNLLAGGNAEGMASWIGREVRAPGKTEFAGNPVDVAMTPVADADRTVLVIRNDFDQIVGRRSLDAVDGRITWDGRNASGTELPHGTYGFSVESYKGDALLDTQDGNVFSEVTEVRLAGGAPQLVLAGGGTVALDAVTGIR